ncbi:hypothetical protein PflCFBP13514_16125 [Pseudomonas fluorescens]|jgi:hypothetical protein|nr:hypothetical protein RU03_18225 [Pseudomonas simiae]TKK03165.1 hypothetical protein PflCFBP13514_16125 [Pseudomonas fluorescens]
MASLFIGALIPLWVETDVGATNVRPVNRPASGLTMAKREQMFQNPAYRPLKPTLPGLRPPLHVAKGLGASVQMARCCLEIVFKSALAPFLNTLKNRSPIGKTRHLIIRSRLPLFRRPVRLSPQVSPVVTINKALSICGLLQKGS